MVCSAVKLRCLCVCNCVDAVGFQAVVRYISTPYQSLQYTSEDQRSASGNDSFYQQYNNLNCTVHQLEDACQWTAGYYA